MRRIVCDTGPLLHLGESDLLSCLRSAGEVLIPPAVARELHALATDWAREIADWPQVAELTDESSTASTTWLHARVLDLGEAEAVALARQLDADWLLTDDAAARVIARSVGLEVHGSLGVVLWAAATGHLDRSGAEDALERLARSSLWVSERVVREARAALQHLFSPTL